MPTQNCTHIVVCLKASCILNKTYEGSNYIESFESSNVSAEHFIALRQLPLTWWMTQLVQLYILIQLLTVLIILSHSSQASIRCFQFWHSTSNIPLLRIKIFHIILLPCSSNALICCNEDYTGLWTKTLYQSNISGTDHLLKLRAHEYVR